MPKPRLVPELWATETEISNVVDYSYGCTAFNAESPEAPIRLHTFPPDEVREIWLYMYEENKKTQIIVNDQLDPTRGQAFLNGSNIVLSEIRDKLIDSIGYDIETGNSVEDV